MSISIRKEIDKHNNLFDDSNWKREYINKIYEFCKKQIGEYLPKYNSNIVEWNGEFIGYDFSKGFDNSESRGKIHLSIRVSNNRYLMISLYSEGVYKDVGDRPTTNFTKVIFSIEQDLRKRYYEPEWSEGDLSNSFRNHISEIENLNLEV